MNHKLYRYLFLIIVSLNFIGCGDISEPYLEAEKHSPKMAIVKVMGTANSEYKTVFGTNLDSSETYSFYVNETGYTAKSDSISLIDYIVNSGNINVFKRGNSRYPDIACRCGEEPMMNLITDGMLYFCRKNFANAKSSSGTKDEGFKKIRIAAHNGGGIDASAILSISDLAKSDSNATKIVKDLFRFSNHLAVVELTPTSLKKLIEYSIAGFKYRNGDATQTENDGASDGNMIHWSGLSFTVNRGATSATNNAFHYNASSGNIDNEGSRVKDIYLFNIPEYDAATDLYDSRLFSSLNNPQDSIPIVLNGVVLGDTPIYAALVDFLALTEKAAQAAMGISGLEDEKLLYVDAINRPNEALDSILSNANYTLYHRLQGRIRFVE